MCENPSLLFKSCTVLVGIFASQVRDPGFKYKIIPCSPNSESTIHRSVKNNTWGSLCVRWKYLLELNQLKSHSKPVSKSRIRCYLSSAMLLLCELHLRSKVKFNGCLWDIVGVNWAAAFAHKHRVTPLHIVSYEMLWDSG